KEEYDSDRCCGYFDEDACPLPDCGVHKTAEECCDDWKDRCVWISDYHLTSCSASGAPQFSCKSKTFGILRCQSIDFSECCCIVSIGAKDPPCPTCDDAPNPLHP
ncbi:MAG: hypothetical protein P9M07_02040, partial [Candidatus Aceula meridiana]|nr:hypothetical protein [Candidatus Aceula meridiana]